VTVLTEAPEVHMPTTTSEDTEITLGTGKLLALFFGLVALCAVFFAVGFSLGRNSVLKTPVVEVAPPVTSTPSAHLTNVKMPSQASSPSAPDTSTATKPADVQTPADNSATSSATTNAAAPAADTNSVSADTPPPPVLNGYYVQVAAVSKQEDADALVDALKKKQYPAFSAESPLDKLFHVQCGPYADVKEAEALRAKLVGDGYNPILKK
jgi:cell division septation protein DedD